MQYNTSDTDYQAMLSKTETLQAENESLKQLLQQFQQIAMLKEREQAMLQQQASAGVEIMSSLQNQSVEIQSHKNYIHELLQKTAAIAQRENELETEAASAVAATRQLEDIKTQYDHLQAQLHAVSERLQYLDNQHILQQQFACRIAELESLLANTDEELTEIKNSILIG